jgi:hypothetical protein
MNTITVKYNAAVLVDAGWRQVIIIATAEKISEKRVSITEVTSIDGQIPVGYQSRTGARRQTFNADSIAAREIGKIKNISTLTLL